MENACLTLVVIAKDQRSLDSLDRTHIHCKMIEVLNPHSKPLAYLANQKLRLCETLVFGLSHADVQYNEGALEAFTEEALRGSVCGLVGAHWDKRYRCCSDLPKEPEVASTLDGMGIFFRTDLGLSFDELTFNGMHCHVEDLCLQATKKNIPITVPAANAHHITHNQGPNWLKDYWVFRRKLTQKWLGMDFVTT